MTCTGNNCGKPTDCPKTTCCGICDERSDCPHGAPCPACTNNESETDH